MRSPGKQEQFVAQGALTTARPMICIVERQKDVDITSLLPHKKVSGPGEFLFIGYSVQLCEHQAELSVPSERRQNALFALQGRRDEESAFGC
jgi:hypothetical protein